MAVLCLLTNTPWPWPTPAGAASARGGVPQPERSGGRTQAGLHKRSAEDWGASCRAPGTEYLRKAWLPCFALSAEEQLGWALRAGKARRGGCRKTVASLPAAGWGEPSPLS